MLSAANELSTRMKQFSSICAPLFLQLEQSSNFKDLEVQRHNLEKHLSELKEYIEDRNLLKKRDVEILTIEHTPIRQLAVEILNNFKVIA